jgi:hypothetical protein
MRVIWILVTVAGALLAPPAAGRAAAGADAAAWAPPLIRAQTVATPENLPDVTLSATVLEKAFDGAENGDYRGLALADRLEAALPAGTDVREVKAPIGPRVPASVARELICCGDGGPGAFRPDEDLATVIEATWPVGGQGGDGESWKTAALGLWHEKFVGIKILNFQLGMTKNQFLSKASKIFPIIVNTFTIVPFDYLPFPRRSKDKYLLVTTTFADELLDDSINIENSVEDLVSKSNVSIAIFKGNILISLLINGSSFSDLFNIKNKPAHEVLQVFINTYDLELTHTINNTSEHIYAQYGNMWNFIAFIENNEVISIQLDLTYAGYRSLHYLPFD